MSAVLEAVALTVAPSRSTAFAHDVQTGLAQAQKIVPGRWLHDARGRELFARIERLEGYYPARAEGVLLARAAPQIARTCGRRAVVVQLGRAPASMTELLLAAVDAAAHVPLDPLTSDFTQQQVLRAAGGGVHAGQRLVFFPGGAIDHFPLQGAMALLENIGQAMGRGTLLVVAADATQDPVRLMQAYDDCEGLWAAFGKNLLTRINRELGGNFDTAGFEHQARWVPGRHRLEAHLVARAAQTVQVQGSHVMFAAGESIRTQCLRKHTLLMFRALARHSGWAQREFWMDPKSGYALHLLEYVG